MLAALLLLACTVGTLLLVDTEYGLILIGGILSSLWLAVGASVLLWISGTVARILLRFIRK